jgi:hypothetical protein
VEACGFTAASTTSTVLSDPGATAHTDGAWTQLIASTSFAYRWLAIIGNNRSDAAWLNNRSTLVDIAIGGAGAEQIILSDLLSAGGSVNDNERLAVCLPVAIPAGSRISARNRSSVGTAGDRRHDLVVYGIG